MYGSCFEKNNFTVSYTFVNYFLLRKNMYHKQHRLYITLCKHFSLLAFFSTENRILCYYWNYAAIFLKALECLLHIEEKWLYHRFKHNNSQKNLIWMLYCWLGRKSSRQKQDIVLKDVNLSPSAWIEILPTFCKE